MPTQLLKRSSWNKPYHSSDSRGQNGPSTIAKIRKWIAMLDLSWETGRKSTSSHKATTQIWSLTRSFPLRLKRQKIHPIDFAINSFTFFFVCQHLPTLWIWKYFRSQCKPFTQFLMANLKLHQRPPACALAPSHEWVVRAGQEHSSGKPTIDLASLCSLTWNSLSKAILTYTILTINRLMPFDCKLEVEHGGLWFQDQEYAYFFVPKSTNRTRIKNADECQQPT